MGRQRRPSPGAMGTIEPEDVDAGAGRLGLVDQDAARRQQEESDLE